ncbi:MAG: DpnI domain-containing protein [Candidatus Baltobacteraceae bacterium]
MRPTVRLDFGEAAAYSSARQVARVAVEAWAARNIRCWRCSSSLLLLPANTALIDAVCSNAGHEVQVKAVAGVARDHILGAAYQPLRSRLERAGLPDYLIVSYDRPRAAVLLAEFIDGNAITAERVLERTPLAATARRAGWVGSTLDLTGLVRHVVVGPSLEPEFSGW